LRLRWIEGCRFLHGKTRLLRRLFIDRGSKKMRAAPRNDKVCGYMEGEMLRRLFIDQGGNRRERASA